MRYKASVIKNYSTLRKRSPDDKLIWAILHGHYNTISIVLSTTSANVYLIPLTLYLMGPILFLNCQREYCDPVLRRTCLFLASSIANVEVVKTLLSFGARVSDRGNILDESPLHIAAQVGKRSPPLFFLTGHNIT